MGPQPSSGLVNVPMSTYFKDRMDGCVKLRGVLKLGKLLAKPGSPVPESHAAMNREVTNMDRREPDNISIPLDRIHHMEFDTRASM